ncbi:SGNH/GDSL hydrolase family protein [Pseudomaricurvus alcaniphilus]|uniref:SGNH/GDSL hydrolase family protein n=1 Tax=Pseudomaricurvus alcaniphilus TaxID=1166482 RepID=UPI00140D0094|nr:SGNH/GDSL hydrolase family protein [Pseudomaricurvus alcaniphilus]
MYFQKSICASFFAAVIAASTTTNAGVFSTIYLFGDSLSDQGNLFAASDSLIPGADNGVPRKDYYSDDGGTFGRFTNGKNWVDLFAENLDMYSLPTLHGGNNFAYGGTRNKHNIVELNSTKPPEVQALTSIIPGLQGDLFPEDAFPWTLQGQTTAFETLGVIDPDALYVVFSGSNDLSETVLMLAVGVLPSSENTLESWLFGVLLGVEQTIDTLIAAGAQEILVPNLPNLGIVPGLVNSQLSGLATQISVQYNSLLKTMLTTKEAKGVNVIHYDFYNLTTEISIHPETFGFTNVTGQCYSGFVAPVVSESITVCDKPQEYAFWDQEHPTTAVHKIMADRMSTQLLPDMLERLRLQITEIDAKTGKPILKKFKSAMKKLEDHNPKNDQAAIKKFESLIKKVKSKQRKKISEDLASSIISRVEKIIGLLHLQL